MEEARGEEPGASRWFLTSPARGAARFLDKTPIFYFYCEYKTQCSQSYVRKSKIYPIICSRAGFYRLIKLPESAVSKSTQGSFFKHTVESTQTGRLGPDIGLQTKSSLEEHRAQHVMESLDGCKYSTRIIQGCVLEGSSQSGICHSSESSVDLLFSPLNSRLRM